MSGLGDAPLQSPSDGFGDFASQGTPTPTGLSIPVRQPLPNRRDSRNWPDASPLHHNEGTSYFQQLPGRPISPTISRRMNQASSMPLSAGGHYAGPSSSAANRRSQHRSASVSSVRQRYGRPAVSEEEDEHDDDDEEFNERVMRDGRRTPALPRDAGNESGGDEADALDIVSDAGSLDPVTLKERQSLINVEHPFGLPIWKPALYKKSRTVTRDAEHALHSDPRSSAERHLLPGNLIWTIVFGWWLALVCFIVAALLFYVPQGGRIYAKLIWGLGWYLFWPFGKYLEGNLDEGESSDTSTDEGDETTWDREPLPGSMAASVTREPTIPEDPHAESMSDEGSASGGTIKGPSSPGFVPSGVPLTEQVTITPTNVFAQNSATERMPLLNGLSYGTNISTPRIKSYGSTPLGILSKERERAESHLLSRVAYLLLFLSIVAPIMLFVTMVCWAIVFTIPMAKLNWELLNYLLRHPLRIRFRDLPPPVVVESLHVDAEEGSPPTLMVKNTRLHAGQQVPGGSSQATVLLCTYRAVGSQYYKYTVGGVNIMFVNLIPIVFFVILDHFVLRPLKDRKEGAGIPVNGFLAFVTSQALIFSLSLASVIPLSYFIGMAVASISAQSSIGMGAVINATFGSIIEIILYAIALEGGKGRLVEGSIVGSLLAGVLLMPGLSMCSGALRKKEQKFNAKSAGVTSTMLIMAIIGTLTPTLFYQTYGEFTLVCDGCPNPVPGQPWHCKRCFYEHLDPATDPFYQETVKSLMYLCASILVLSYLIGLWFSLRTHASQIWQNPQQLMQPIEGIAGSNRLSMYNKLLHSDYALPTHRPRSLNRKPSSATVTRSRSGSNVNGQASRISDPANVSGRTTPVPPSPSANRRVTYAPPQALARGETSRSQQPSSSTAAGYTPLIDSVAAAVRDNAIPPINLPPALTADDFSRAVAVATVSALRQQQDPYRQRAAGLAEPHHEEHSGHDAPSWSRLVSASVLLGCTVLYALIAEILVDCVDVVLEGSGLDEKFLGITLFALVPNTTEFMNAISFALNNNIALSMEIGSAYALQVCLLQIPAMVAFSAWHDPDLDSIADTFTLIFPRWDVIAIIFSIFLLTYVYIEAKGNYYRGSILVLSYIVLVSGFYFAPPRLGNDEFRSFPLSMPIPDISSLQTSLYSIWAR